MERTASVSFASIIALLFVGLGCEPPLQPEPPAPLDGGCQTPACVFYAPERIDILPLTEFKVAEGDREARLDVYVSLVDSAGSQMKFPVKFRFELYEQVQRSPEPKGRRARIWPQIDQTDPNESIGNWFDLGDPLQNNRFWQDFMRAYQFSLPFTPQPQANYILEVTCLTDDGRRLSAEIQVSAKR